MSDEVSAEMEARVAEIERVYPPERDPTAAEPPSLEEVAASVKALRNFAAPGVDEVDARMLKAGPVVLEWLHRVITVAWKSRKAHVEWKKALIIPIYKNKGRKDEPGNYRGISMLSIPGKVYASVQLHKVAAQVEPDMDPGQPFAHADGSQPPKLNEAQCGFKRGRGTVDAMFVLGSLGVEYNTCFAKAYIDLTKACDSVNRGALWKVLHLYGVHPKLIAMLADLHFGTYAAVRVGGRSGPAFEVTTRVHHGCVYAPMLFNIFLDYVTREALRGMPDGCGVHIEVQHSSPLHADRQDAYTRDSGAHGDVVVCR